MEYRLKYNENGYHIQVKKYIFNIIPIWITIKTFEEDWVYYKNDKEYLDYGLLNAYELLDKLQE